MAGGAASASSPRRRPPPDEVFEAVVEELGRLLGVGSTGLVRYDGSGHAGRLWGATSA